MPPRKRADEETQEATVDSSAQAEQSDPIPPFETTGGECSISLSITRKYGAIEITLHKEVYVIVRSLADQHREYDKLAQQLEWHHGRIANERFTKGKPDGQRPK